MKKRFFAMLLGTIVLFNTVGSDFVSLAEGVIEETESVETTDTVGETNEYEEAAVEEVEEAAVEEVEEAAEEVIQEVLEDDNDLDNEGKLDVDEQDKENAGDDELSGEEKASEEELANEDSDEDVSDEDVSDEEASDEELTDDEILDDEELDDELLEEEIEEEEEEEEEEEVPFEQAKTVSGVRITLTAAEGVLPEGAYFNAKEIEDVSSIEDAVEKELTDSQKITEVKAFDITLYDADGEEIQPDTSKGEVKVKFTNIDTSEAKSNDNVDMEVFHVADDASSATEMGTYVGNDEVSFNTEHFSTYAVVSIEDKKADDTKELDEWALVDSVSFTDTDGNEITDDSTVSTSSTYKVTYTLKSPLSLNYDEDYQTDESKTYISKDNTYKLPSLSATSFNLSAIEDFTVYVNENGNKVEFGTVSVDSDGSVSLAVTYESNKEVYDVVIGIEFGLNSDSIGTNTEYEFTIPTATGTTTVTALIAENQPNAPTIEKTASELDDNDDITWTVKITNDSNPITYESGYKFVDSFSSNQSYVSGSFTVNGSTATPTTDDGELTYSFTDNEKSSVTYITYKTHVDFLSSGSTQNGTISLDIKNSAKLYDANDTSATIAEDSVSKSVSSKTLANWITKEGGELNSNGVAEWKITVETNGYNLKNLTVYDVFSTDSSTVMSLVEDSVVVTDTVGDTTTTLASSDYDIVNVAGTSDKNKSYNWYLRFKGANSDYKLTGSHTFTITYKTQIKDYTTFLQTNHTVIPGNYAFLEYEYDYTGNGDYKLLLGPTLSKVSVTGTGVTTKAAIEKSCVSYDASTHTITWKVVANKNYQALTNTKITELIQAGQEFYSISDATITDAVGNTSEYTIEDSNMSTDSDGNKVIDFGSALNGASATFTVVTKLTDAQCTVWAGNNSGTTYYNKVQLDSDQQTKVTDTASCTYKSTVLEKTASSYDYDTHEITYTITVNRNKMAMSGVVVTDDLGTLGMSLVDDSVTLTKGSGSATSLDTDSSNASYYEYKDGVLTVHLADITDVGSDDAMEVIQLVAHVDDGDIFTSTNGGTVSITNTAKLDTDQNTATVSASKKISWVNTVINKSASVDTTTKAITYTVVLNGNRQVLDTNLIIRDTLGSSLALDFESVKLYLGEINSSTGEVTSTGNEEEDYSKKMYASGNKTVLDVTLPQKENNTNIYVLTYTAMPIEITSSGDYTNGVQLVGYASSESNNDSANVSYSSFGGGWTVDPFYLTVTKIDADDEAKVLEGATFVIKDTSGNVVDTIVTKANGKAVSVGKLAKDTEYTIEETVAPTDYELSTEVKSFTTPSEGGLDNAVNISFADTKKSLSISISKEDGSGNAVLDANLSITRTLTDGTEKIVNWTTDGTTYEFDAAVDVEYTLHEDEESVPFGYNTASDIKFKVSETTLYIWDDGEYKAVDSTAITMIDAPLDSLEFSVSKVSASQGNELTGATLLISKESTLEAAKSNYIDKWTSDGVAKEFAFPAGTYYLYELSAPTGYKLADSIAFKVVENGDSLKLQLADENGDFVDAESTNIVMTDDYNEEVKYTITFSPKILKMDPTLFSEMKLQLYTLDPINGELVLVEPATTQTDDPTSGDPTSGDPTSDDPTSDGPTTDNPTSEEPSTDDSTTTELTYKLNYQQEYILKPTGSIEGYDPVAPITIKVTNDGKLVAKTLDSDTFTETNLVELGETVTPKLTAVIEEPTEEPQETPTEEPTNDPQETPSETPAETPATGPAEEPTEVPAEIPAEITDAISEEKKEELTEETSENNTGSSNGGSGVRVATGNVADTALELKENVIEATADLQTNDDSVEMNSGARLAQTGGFIGTLISYLFALFAIAAGLFLVFGKEKRAK